MRTPAMWSFGSCTPPFAAVVAVARALGGEEEQVAEIVGSPCDVMHSTADTTTGFAGSLTSQIVKPAKLPW